jgi:hypothetical protein
VNELEANIEANNKLILNDIVLGQFHLDEGSKKRFSKLLFNRHGERLIDPIYKELLGDDLRYRFKLEESKFPLIDIGWEMFQTEFKNVFGKLKIEYKNYKENKITNGSQTFKLFKAMKKYYLDNEEDMIDFLRQHEDELQSYYRPPTNSEMFSELFQRKVEQIGAWKLPDREIEVVITANFADFFLCASKEKWTSCINVDSGYSGAFWSGLPGTIADPNRVMIYITDGEKKNYRGIEVDKIIVRTWGVLSSDNNIFPSKSYPGGILQRENLKEILGDKFNFTKMMGRSKHPIDLLYHKNNESCFVYQDRTEFMNVTDDEGGNLFYIIDKLSGNKMSDGNYGGVSIVDKNTGDIDVESSFCCDTGLSYMIEEDQSLGHYCGDDECEDTVFVCAHCGEVSEFEEFYFRGDHYCESCYDERYTACTTCRDVFPEDEMFPLEENGERICSRCKQRNDQLEADKRRERETQSLTEAFTGDCFSGAAAALYRGYASLNVNQINNMISPSSEWISSAWADAFSPHRVPQTITYTVDVDTTGENEDE